MSIEGYYTTIGTHNGNDLGEVIASDDSAATAEEARRTIRDFLRTNQQSGEEQTVVLWQVTKIATYESRLVKTIKLHEIEGDSE